MACGPISHNFYGSHIKATKVFIFIESLHTIAVALAALAGRTSLTLVTSLFVEEEKTSVKLIWRVASAAFHWIIASFRMYAHWLNCTSVIYFTYGMLSTLERMVPPYRPSEMNIYGSAIQFAGDFRALSVLQAHYAGLYMRFIAIIQVTSIYSITFNAYQVIVDGSVRSLFMALAASSSKHWQNRMKRHAMY